MVAHHVLQVANTDFAVGPYKERHGLGSLFTVDERQVGVHAALEAVEVAPHAGVAATQRAEIAGGIDCGKFKIGIFAVIQAHLAGKGNHVLAINAVFLVFQREFIDAALVGVSGDAVVGEAACHPHCTLFLAGFTHHFKNPYFVGVTYRERFTLAVVAILGYQVGHHLDGFTGSLGTLERDIDEASIVHDGTTCLVDHLFASSKGGLGDRELVLVDVSHHGIGVSYFGNFSMILARIPVVDCTLVAGLVVGGRKILQIAVKGVRVGGIGN